jgi:hypothetical protein
MRHLEDMQIQMRLNILKQKVAVGLSALLLATPMSVFAQNSRLSQKLADGQGLEPTRQELATLSEEGTSNGAAGRHKIAPDLDQSVDAVSYSGGRDKRKEASYHSAKRQQGPPEIWHPHRRFCRNLAG